MKKVYICSPCRGDYEHNIDNALRYCREAVMLGILPIAPHVYFTRFLDDTIAEERVIGIKLANELLAMCNEVWVYGEPSEGMKAEIALATVLHIPVVDKAEVTGQ